MEDTLEEVVVTTEPKSRFHRGKDANNRQKARRRVRLKSGLVVYANLLKSGVSRNVFVSRLDSKQVRNLQLVETEAIRAQIEAGVSHREIIDGIVSNKARAEAEKKKSEAAVAA